MLSGKRAFPGEDVSETLASILKDTPSLDRLPTDTPPGVRRLLQRCFERDVKQRLRDIGEARVEIAKIVRVGPILRPPPPPSRLNAARSVKRHRLGRGRYRRHRRVADRTFGRPKTHRRTARRATAVCPAKQRGGHRPRCRLISPGRTNTRVLRPIGVWRQADVLGASLDSLAAQPFPDTEDASEPFWSPDSRSVGFGAQEN